MEGLTSWAAAVCAVAVICALFEILAPTGNISKCCILYLDCS